MAAMAECFPKSPDPISRHRSQYKCSTPPWKEQYKKVILSAVTVICVCAVFYFNLWMQVFLVTSQYMVILRARFRKFVVVDC